MNERLFMWEPKRIQSVMPWAGAYSYHPKTGRLPWFQRILFGILSKLRCQHFETEIGMDIHIIPWMDGMVMVP